MINLLFCGFKWIGIIFLIMIECVFFLKSHFQSKSTRDFESRKVTHLTIY